MSVAEPLTPGCWKRRGSEGEDDSNSTIKKAKYSWYVTLESESPQPTSSDEDESIYSIQAQETEYARDTSDTSTSTWISSGEDAVEEYEPVSLSADENPFIDCLSSSDPELQISQHIAGYVGAIAAAAAMCDSDVDLADDSDDSLTSRDSEISHADYWTCVQCNNKNNKPLFRYCEKCYRVRKLFLPPRPKGKKRRKEIKKRWSRRSRALEGGGDSLVSQDSGLGSSLGSQPPNSPQPCSSWQSENLPEKSLKPSKEASEKFGSEVEFSHASQESQESIATTVSVSNLSDSSDDDVANSNADFAEKIRQATLKTQSVNDENNKHCLICTVGPKNSIFVHGRDSHICCCYRCAIKVWKTTKHCPICKRKVTDVIKAYYA
ncbi:E3 ubiquitin-protein ligase Mdm2-like isoform X2 [Venturia canescens]|uniref:E3 ubiquitin-protein ligase Mdm2-like isoform X2 n=1 Tax=Venturia canescens TaxID=32260 RepID=UPI001C9CD72D|nr:E3 ubiquitin-protein ligase Mdm2-like isoform X2 [Venturia canescens]